MKQHRLIGAEVVPVTNVDSKLILTRRCKSSKRRTREHSSEVKTDLSELDTIKKIFFN